MVGVGRRKGVGKGGEEEEGVGVSWYNGVSAGGGNLSTLTRFTPSTVLFGELYTEIGFHAGSRGYFRHFL